MVKMVLHSLCPLNLCPPHGQDGLHSLCPLNLYLSQDQDIVLPRPCPLYLSVLPMVKEGSQSLCPLNLYLSQNQDSVTMPLSSKSLSSPWSRWCHRASVLSISLVPMVKMVLHSLCPLNLSLSHGKDGVTQPMSSQSLSFPW
jgi:hypothetical protein